MPFPSIKSASFSVRRSSEDRQAKNSRSETRSLSLNIQPQIWTPLRSREALRSELIAANSRLMETGHSYREEEAKAYAAAALIKTLEAKGEPIHVGQATHARRHQATSRLFDLRHRKTMGEFMALLQLISVDFEGPAFRDAVRRVDKILEETPTARDIAESPEKAEYDLMCATEAAETGRPPTRAEPELETSAAVYLRRLQELSAQVSAGR